MKKNKVTLTAEIMQAESLKPSPNQYQPKILQQGVKKEVKERSISRKKSNILDSAEW